MPVKGKEEPGVLSRQTSNCYAGIPIKKRRFPLIPPPSPSHEEPPPSLPETNDVKNKDESSSGKEPLHSLLEKNEVKNKEESISGKEQMPSFPDKVDVKNEEESSSGKEPSLEANLAIDSTDKPDVGTNLKKVKKETSASIDGTSVKTSELCGSRVQETIPVNAPQSVNNINNQVKPLLIDKSASPIVPASNPVFSTVNVKEQIISSQAEGYFKLELSAGSGNPELSIGLQEQPFSALGQQQSEGSSQMSDKIDPSLLSLSLGKENPVTESKSRYSGITSESVHVDTDRSNWDLNTPMDTWDSSVKDAAFDDSIGIKGFNKSSSGYEVMASLNSTSVVGVSVDKGKQVIDPYEKKSNICLSSMCSREHDKSEDSLRLSLSTCFPGLEFSREYSASSTKVGSSSIISNSNLKKLTTKTTSSGCKTVKSEPVDENSRLDSLPFNGSPMGSLDNRLVKREIVERQIVEVGKMSSSNPQKLVEPISVKSEVGQEHNQETRFGTNVFIHQSVAKVVQRQESCSSSSSSTTTISMPLTPQQTSSSVLPYCSELSASGGDPNQSENSLHTEEVHKSEDVTDHPAADTIPEPLSHIGIEPNVSNCNVNSGQGEDSNVEDSDRLKRSGELDRRLHAIAEGSVSDEEKINISADMPEDDAYGSDYESDGNHSIGDHVDMEVEPCGKEDNEYEDGEVREPLIHSSLEDKTFKEMEKVDVKQADDDTKIVHPIDLPDSCNTDKIHFDEKQSQVKLLHEKNNDHPTDRSGAETNGDGDQLMEDDFPVQNSLLDTAAAVVADEKTPENGSLDQSGEKDLQEAKIKGLSGDGGTNMDSGIVTAVSEATGEIAEGTNMVGNANSSLSKAAETKLDGQDAAKEPGTGGSRSRIINLPRASNLTSPSRIRSIPDRSLSSRSGRERYSDLERDGIHLRGTRDNIYADFPNKSRDRIQDQPFRGSRPNFMRGRGRVSGRLGTLQGEWDPDHDFAAETFDGPADYRFTRHRRASAITDAGLECNDFVVSSDAAAMGSGRGGRKPSTEELYAFRHPSSRRLSPGARDASATRNIQMFRRVPRNIGEAGSDLAGVRHEKKIIRGLPDDVTDSFYTRPQVAYEELDGQFVRGNRKFSTVQRRGFPRVRSKSPINTRPRSPRPWTSPRRRLTDGFNGLSDQSQHRSPVMYRMDRMRSPDRVGYTEEMGSRRHVSPTYAARTSNDIRDMDSARGHGHIRSINSGRSPSDRAFPRSTRRLDVVDPRERVDADDYFAGSMHAGRFHEFRGDGSSDERKRYGERRSPIRSFRAPYSGNSDGYCFNSEDGSRPLRFRPDQDTGIFERSNIRERDFDGLIKNRSLTAPGRIRNIEEQEGNYRQTGQIWHDDAFDDDSRLKRRRF